MNAPQVPIFVTEEELTMLMSGLSSYISESWDTTEKAQFAILYKKLRKVLEQTVKRPVL